MDRQWLRNGLQFMGGALGVAAISLGIMAGLNIIDEYYFWSIHFGIFTLPAGNGHTWATALQLLKGYWPFALLPIYLVKKKELMLFLMFLFSISATLGAFPRWEMFHLLPALPILSILLVLTWSSSFRGLYMRLILIGHLSVLIFLVGRFFTANWRQPDRFFEPEIIEAVKYIREYTNEEDTIFVFNTWDSIYALSDRLPATRPWVPILPWYTEYPGIQDNMITTLIGNRPTIIVAREYEAEGLGAYQPKQIDRFIKSNYKTILSLPNHHYLLIPTGPHESISFISF